MFYNLYHYDPSKALLSVGCILFALLSIGHTWSAVKARAVWWTAFLVGGWMEVAGFIARGIGTTQLSALSTYIVQTLFLLLPPAFFSASIYMTLRRLVVATARPDLLIIPMRLCTRLFVGADVLSLLLQGAGGGLQTSTNDASKSLGQKLVIVGLCIQLVAFTFFLITTWIFSGRLARTTQEVRKIVIGISISGPLILIRSVYRVVEYAQGYTGYIMTHEWALYVFDTLPMLLLTFALFILFPPVEMLAIKAATEPSREHISIEEKA
ncbi:hypothetical protein PYCC9005_005866 [Savitreella phatthalungensis]